MTLPAQRKNISRAMRMMSLDNGAMLIVRSKPNERAMVFFTMEDWERLQQAWDLRIAETGNERLTMQEFLLQSTDEEYRLDAVQHG